MKKPRICVITAPRPKAGLGPLSDLLAILMELSNSLFLITGDQGEQACREQGSIQVYSVRRGPSKAFFPAKIIGNIVLQFRVSYRLARLRQQTDIYYFFMAEGLALPMIVAKLLRKKVVLGLASSVRQIARSRQNLYTRITGLNEALNYALADRIVVYSPTLIQEWYLTKYNYKITVAPRHFIDFVRFPTRRSFSKRAKLIGYIGRFSEEKGVLNLVDALPKILEQEPDVNVLLVGDGPLKDKIIDKLTMYNLNEKVQITGWIRHEDIPDCLEDLRLLILPSYTEGLPTLMIEAMACGTPIIANRVGAIPDIIKDGETGYIMENNAPDTIASGVVNALKSPALQRISENTRTFVENEFTYSQALERYRKVLSQLI